MPSFQVCEYQVLLKYLKDKQELQSYLRFNKLSRAYRAPQAIKLSGNLNCKTYEYLISKFYTHKC